ncbi:MAG: [FeFe] hydrogenase H-cluster radical SAM maturase HydE [Bacteroidales bacterium]|jgi:biotin synthase|nr:[FeFe] hydrogenase H-cluster radical SAM maturase HydE [Bacteroidales bacterium]
MSSHVDEILQSACFSKSEIMELLCAQGEEQKKLFAFASQIKQKHIGNNVYFRGLIEYSNHCAKDCLYCGIRRSNKNVNRYSMTDMEVLEAVRYAHEENYASLVLQSGEIDTPFFTDKITALLLEIGKATQHSMGITLSMGEQRMETLRAWKNAGARRYLLRIETSNPDLYKKIHPQNQLHDFYRRLDTLRSLREAGYQTGTGVMIGLPFQTIEDMAEDLLFFQDLDVDMVGMGPYIEHKDTPLYQYKDSLLPLTERFNLTLKMIAVLRIMMKDINIVASTAMQTMDKMGREKALIVGANIIMPNLTPRKYRGSYLLYENKPCIDEEAHQCKNCLQARMHLIGCKIGYGEWGDSKHFKRRTINQKNES